MTVKRPFRGPHAPRTQALLLVASLCLGACKLGNDKMASDRTEALGHAEALRSNAMQVISNECGASLGPNPLVTRRPYLQPRNETTMKVMWTSRSPAEPALRLTRPGQDEVTLVPAKGDGTVRRVMGAGLFHATLDELQPDTLYCYEVLMGGEVAARGGFRTPPPPGSGKQLSVLAFGDSGDGGASQQAIYAQMHTVPIDLMIHVGDIAYDHGTRVEFENNFFRVYEELLERFAFLPASGNHEYETEDAAPFREVFALPENGGPEGVERWYSYDWGDVHFVVLDTEKIGATQAAWLDADLAASTRAWKIVYAHRPPFSSNPRGGDPDFRRVFLPILERHRVPLVLSGHDHHYERTRAINGVTYIVTGGGGRYLRETGTSPQTAYAESVLHFVTFTISNDELVLHAIDAVGNEFDNVVIQRPTEG